MCLMWPWVQEYHDGGVGAWGMGHGALGSDSWQIRFVVVVWLSCYFAPGLIKDPIAFAGNPRYTEAS